MLFNFRPTNYCLLPFSSKRWRFWALWQWKWNHWKMDRCWSDARIHSNEIKGNKYSIQFIKWKLQNPKLFFFNISYAGKFTEQFITGMEFESEFAVIYYETELSDEDQKDFISTFFKMILEVLNLIANSFSRVKVSTLLLNWHQNPWKQLLHWLSQTKQQFLKSLEMNHS